MKQKSSLRTAAASTAAVLETSASANSQIMNAPEHTESSPIIRKPIEVNLADPGAADYRGDGAVELFAQLEELYPGDPGQRSGVVLRISEYGPHVWLVAEIGNVQQSYDDGPSTHCLGFLRGEEVGQFAEEATTGAGFVTSLRELYHHAHPDALSGATLIFFGRDEPEIQLCFGAHCLGVLRGRLLTALLESARTRSASLTETGVK
jgi:hypothetical protein